MTIQNTGIRKAGPSQGNGVNTAFPFTFKVFVNTDVLVTYLNASGIETALVLATDYTVVLNSDQNISPGGTVTLSWIPATGTYITLTSVVPNTQTLALTNSGGFYPASINDALDRCVVLIQQLVEQIGRALKTAVSTPDGFNATLPAPVPYQVISWNGAGNGFGNIDPTYSTALATDLATASASKGAALVGFLAAATGAVGTTSSKWMNRRSLSVFDFMTDAQITDVQGKTAALDVTAAMQAAINSAQLRGLQLIVPAGVYRLDTTLSITSGIDLVGVPPKAKNAGGADFFGGTWLYFNHTGKGISITNSSGYMTDVSLRTVGTRRNQPNPAANWTPNDHDYDVYCYGVADVSLDDVLMLNPTRGIGVFGNPVNGGGRINFYKIRGQAFKVLINVDTVYDVCRYDQIHAWPFWRDDMNVHTYCMNNLDALISGRSDNPLMSNIFTIFARAGLRCVQGENGATSKLHLANVDFDRGAHGIWVDSTVTNGVTGQVTNMTHQGETGHALSTAIFIQGNNSNLDFANFRTDLCAQNGVRVEGTANLLRFANAAVMNFDQIAAGFPAIEAFSGNRLEFANKPLIGDGGTGGAYNASGTIVADQWRAFTPVVSAQTGTITTLGTVTGLYKVVGDTVQVKSAIAVTTNGTAGGDVRFNLPFGTPVETGVGGGRERTITGKALQVVTTGTQAAIYNYDNSYPAANGCILDVDFQYRISL